MSSVQRQFVDLSVCATLSSVQACASPLVWIVPLLCQREASESKMRFVDSVVSIPWMFLASRIVVHSVAWESWTFHASRIVVSHKQGRT